MTEPNVSEKTGFLVWTKKGSNPRAFHPTIESATAEANRLAAKFPGKAFFVVSMVTKHKVTAPAETIAEAA